MPKIGKIQSGQRNEGTGGCVTSCSIC